MTGFSRNWSDVESYDLSGGCDYATPETSNSEGTLETNDVFNEHHHEKTCFVRPTKTLCILRISQSEQCVRCFMSR